MLLLLSLSNGCPQKYQCSFTNVIAAADGSAARLVNLLARDFPCFRDEFPFEGRRKPIRFLKRAQILVADLWACFQGESYGAFRDIDKITMFADYRLPQMLNSLGCIFYSPSLDLTIRDKKVLESGSKWEMQLRGTSSLAEPKERKRRIDSWLSVQHMVCRTDPAGDRKGAPGCQDQRHPD